MVGPPSYALLSPLRHPPVPMQAGDVAVAELLLQAGANIDAVEVMRRTPLM